MGDDHDEERELEDRLDIALASIREVTRMVRRILTLVPQAD